MTRTTFAQKSYTALLFALCIFCLSGVALSQELAGKEPQPVESMPGGNPITIMAIPEDNFFRMVQPPQVLSLYAPTSTFTINFINSGTNAFGDSCTAWPTEARNALQYAANVWGTYLQSNVPVTINACWATNLATGVLGHSGPKTFYRNFTGAPQTGTFYPVALANALAGSDLDSTTADMEMAYSSTFSWYHGTDGNPGTGKYDFVSVSMHEIGHGLGFLGSMAYSGGQGQWGLGSGTVSPVIYDRFTENGSGQSLINTAIFSNPSTSLGSQLTSGNLYFNGTNANSANGGTKVKIYAPATWAGGSSYAHLDFDTYKNTGNALMVYAIGSAEARHVPGPVTLGLFKDLGWGSSGGGTCSLTTPTLVSPSGTATTTPTYSWSAVSGAEKYELYVSDSAGAGKLDAWYTASQVSCSSGTGTCSVTPTTALASGSATFWVRAWASCNGGTYSAWSSSKTFTVSGGGGTCSLTAPTLVSPSGTATTTPTYSWYAVSGAEYYMLYVTDSTKSGKISDWYTASQAGCSSGTGTCSLTPSTALASGSATFWIKAWASCNGGTESSWSSGKTFTVSGGGGTCSLTTPTLVSPSGTATTTPTYSWYAVSGAEYYRLYVSDSSASGKIDAWYTASQASCSSGTCSLTPSTALASGSATFWVMAWSSCNGGTYSLWSSAKTFTVSGGGTCSLTAPTLVSPSGTATTTPTYSWYAVSGAEYYRLYVTDATTSGKIDAWYTASSAGCSSGTCSLTPSTALASGSATFWVKAWASCNGGTESSWSSGKTFTVSGGGSGTGFNEQFDGSSAPNWTQNSGSWSVSSGYYHADGAGYVDRYLTSTYNSQFSDLDYSALMTRYEKDGNYYWGSAALVIRASGSFDGDDYANCYVFTYHRGGKFNVEKRVNGTYTTLQSWTTHSAVKQGDLANKLRVVAKGTALYYYINDTLVWSGSDSSLSSGRVGFQFFSESGVSDDQLWVDSATLSTYVGAAPAVNLTEDQKLSLDLANSGSKSGVRLPMSNAPLRPDYDAADPKRKIQ